MTDYPLEDRSPAVLRLRERIRNRDADMNAHLASLPGTMGAGYAAVPDDLIDAEVIPLSIKRWREPYYAHTAHPDSAVVRVDERGRNMGQMIFE